MDKGSSTFNRQEAQEHIANTIFKSMAGYFIWQIDRKHGGNFETALTDILREKMDKFCSDENLKDMLGFIHFSEKHRKSPAFIAENLIHDITGIADHDCCFLPRTTGYATTEEARP